MKILIIHNFHRSGAPSGDDAVVRQEMVLLQRNGHNVTLFSKHNDSFERFSLLKKVETFTNLHFSPEIYNELKAILSKEKFDIVHIHNLFPLITPAAYFACKDTKVPLVHTLHDFRFFCANAFLFRNGNICELCPTESTINAAKYKCFKNSFIGSVFVARYLSKIKKERYFLIPQKYIALTEFSKQKFIEFGIPTEKIVVKPNFVENSLPNPKEKKADYFVYAGRLSEEKGIKILIKAFADDRLRQIPLKIIGSGPLEWELKQAVEKYNLKNIEILGLLSRLEVLKQMESSIATIFPSILYETFGLTIVESFSVGTSVIASNFGTMSVLIKPFKTGLLFEKGNPEDLAEKILYLYNNRELAYKMGKNAREEYLQKYTPEVNYNMLMQIYEEAIKESQ
jgi:glycosyltransferase involved in cell wall biosynthesis